MSNIPEEDSRYTNLHKWFLKMALNRSKVVNIRKEDEEFYYSDIEGTRSQFTRDQLELIEKKYDIPISTKISYAIIEQILSFLSGTKPYPRLIAPSDIPESKLFTQIYEQAHNAVWYESKAQNDLTSTIRDMLTTGSGFMITRKNNFFEESTFNVIVENVPWTDVLIDPASRKPDYTDAEMMCIVKVLPVSKAEKEYDINLDSDDTITSSSFMTVGFGSGQVVDPFIFPSAFSTGDHANGDGSKFKNDSYVWVREFFEKKKVNVYISENGDISSKKPTPVQVPNPVKEQLRLQIEQMVPMMQQAQQVLEQQAQQVQQASDNVQQSDDPQQAIGQQQQVEQGANQEAEAASQAVQQFQALQQEFASEPDLVPAYTLIGLNGESKTVFRVDRIEKKRIERTLVVGQKILESEILPCSEFPITHFCISHKRSPNATYGVIHYIKDVLKAINKFYANAVYDLAVNSHRKILAADGTIENIPKFEDTWSKPGSVTTWTPNEALGGKDVPQIIDASPVNPSMMQLVDKLMSLAEYITGIFGVVQGNNSGAPDTFGGTSSLQNFGTQRVKLYGRYIESSLETLALNTIEYLQAFAPRDKTMQYFGKDNQPEELKIMDGGTDMKFKVRVSISNNLPTARHMAAQLLATIGGQTRDPNMANLLTQYTLQVMDIPEADEILKAMDVVNNLQQQLQQAQEQLQEQDGTIKSLQNQFQNATIGNTISEARQDVDHATELAIAKGEEQKNQEAVPQTNDVPF